MATVMVAMSPESWQLAEPGRRCRAMIRSGNGTDPSGGLPFHACGRPAVFQLNRRHVSTASDFRRKYRPLWYGYCADLEHCYRRVLVDDGIYFVYEEDEQTVAEIIDGLRRQR